MGYKVFITAGEAREITGSIVGSEAVKSLDKYNFTKGFFGTNGIDTNAGFTTYEEKEALIKEAAMSKCREAFVLSDNSKFNKIAPITFGKIHNAVIITYKDVNNLLDEDMEVIIAK